MHTNCWGNEAVLLLDLFVIKSVWLSRLSSLQLCCLLLWMLLFHKAQTGILELGRLELTRPLWLPPSLVKDVASSLSHGGSADRSCLSWDHVHDLPSQTSLCLKDKVTSDVLVSNDSYQPPAFTKQQVGNMGCRGWLGPVFWETGCLWHKPEGKELQKLWIPEKLDAGYPVTQSKSRFDKNEQKTN